MAVALATLDAIVQVRRASGEAARFGLDDFYRLPGDTPARETVLEHGDLITGVELPPPPPRAVMRYRKVRDRASYAFAVVSIAAVLPTDGASASPRIALGGVAARPWRCRRVEQALSVKGPSAELLRSACAEEFAAARPLPGNAFKIGLATELITATILDLTGGK
jgi:xanthine dehydrogenase YagS FAD-binding subunit